MIPSSETRGRAVAGLLIGAVVAVLGPVTVAVGTDSRNHVDQKGSVPAERIPVDASAGTFANVQRGAVGEWYWSDDGVRSDRWIFLGALGANGTASSEHTYVDGMRRAGYAARVAEDVRVYLWRQRCVDGECSWKVWRGSKGFAIDPTLSTATYDGTLKDAQGKACVLKVHWAAPVQPIGPSAPDHEASTGSVPDRWGRNYVFAKARVRPEMHRSAPATIASTTCFAGAEPQFGYTWATGIVTADARTPSEH